MPQCNFKVSIIKRLPALELFISGAYIRNYTVCAHTYICARIYYIQLIITKKNSVYMISAKAATAKEGRMRNYVQYCLHLASVKFH